MVKWIEPQEVLAPESLITFLGGHSLVAQVLARRGITDVHDARRFLYPDYYNPAHSSELPGIYKAVNRIESAIHGKERICVWGDFDVDGQTATTLLVSTLLDLGANVFHYIPIRKTESHGISPTSLKNILEQDVKLLLTCDTGIAEHEAISYAKSQGVDVVVTDHHTLPPQLPEAHAIVNPQMLPKDHPLHNLPGVGCAYKLAELLYEGVQRPEQAARMLDLVALGIVADVALQTGDTRYLLQRGLDELRNTQRLGLQVLMENASIRHSNLTEEDIGFALAPRLNALGRLSDANIIVEFLTTRDLGRARIIANQLEGLNAERKLLTSQVFQAAQAQIDRDPSTLKEAALVMSHPKWPAGVIGIVANRLVERYRRPVILIATPPGELARGSARSIEGCNITSAIAKHKNLLNGFGGHSMAAGLSIDPENIPEFRRAISLTVGEMVEEVDTKAGIQIDAYMPLSEITLEVVEDLEKLAPFGPGNPPIILVSERISIKNHRPMGRSEEHLTLEVEDESRNSHNVIWWQGTGFPLPEGLFDLAYSARISHFRDQRNIQIEWIDFRNVEETPIEVTRKKGELQIVDYRNLPDPDLILDELKQSNDLQIWSEGVVTKKIGGRDRSKLTASQNLAIWSTPPGPDDVRKVLSKVSPDTVYLFLIDPGFERFESFVKHLAGLLKFALNAYKGKVTISRIIASTAHKEKTVCKGIEWLVAKGYYKILAKEQDYYHIVLGDGNAKDVLPEITEQLESLLAETRAFRDYLSRTNTEALTSLLTIG